MATYTLRVETDFAAAHSLRGYDGNCARLHGHNWKVEVEMTGERLDGVGMLVDFKTMKKAAREVAARVDHLYLNEIPPFDEINPTAENIAAWFFEQVAALLNGPTAQVSAVTIWETERAAVTYRESP
ncbi:MAG: 6-carboxytetrahydropterin synthase QueD [Halothiobacillaceae bacterium]